MNNDSPLILIVDDNLKNLKYLGTLLRENAYEVGIAQDGFKALEFLKETRPDLVLLDIMMPGMDDYEVCRISLCCSWLMTAKPLLIILTNSGQSFRTATAKE